MKKKIKNKVVNKKVLNKKVPLTKSLGDLMKDEDGFVSKETILRVGLSTVAALGIAGALTDMSSASHTNASDASVHNNSFSSPSPNSSGQSCVTHTNVTTHTSY